MSSNIKISNNQTTLLVIMVIVGGNLLFIPSMLASDVHQDGWISSVVGLCIGILIALFYSVFASLFPNLTFAQLCEKTLGKVFGKFVAFFMYIYFFIYVTIGIRQIGDFFLIQMLPETPLYIVHILFIAAIIIGTRLGLETFARAAQVCFPFMILLFFFLIVFSFPDIKSENFLPMLENGMIPVIGSAIHFQGFSYLNLVVFLMIFPSIKSEGKLRKSMIIGTIIGGASLILMITLSIGVLSAETVIRESYPGYILAKKIYIGDFLTRIEVIIALIWLLTVYFKVTFYFYALSQGLAESLQLKDYRILLSPLGILTLVYSIAIFPNSVYALETENAWNWLSYGLTVGLLIPLFVLVVAKIRKI